MKTKTILTTLALIATLTSCKKQEVNRKDYRTVKVISKVVSDRNFFQVFKNYQESITQYYNDTIYHRCYVGDTLYIAEITPTLYPNFIRVDFDIYTQKNGKGSFTITNDYTLTINNFKKIIVK